MSPAPNLLFPVPARFQRQVFAGSDDLLFAICLRRFASQLPLDWTPRIGQRLSA
ncbi:MAG: hypothetical protein H0X45_02795 [Planctomycetes bacterium]|nr:hypothetical protein [Planctomycetota bacterium]